MPHRDPETGQFVADSGQFDEYEQINFNGNVTVPAADLTGAAGQGLGEEAQFEGVELYDLDEVLDRRERGHLVAVMHRLQVAAVSTETADGTVRSAAEISFTPALQAANEIGVGTDIPDSGTDFSAQFGGQEADDTEDVIGPVLSGWGFAPFSDGATGVGGSGNAGVDEYHGPGPFPVTADSRDSIYWNGWIGTSNIDDGSVSVELSVRHVYGIEED